MSSNINPWRHGDINELIVKASNAGDTSRVKALEKVRGALIELEAIKGGVADDPLAALAKAIPTITEILSAIDEENDRRNRGAES